MSAMEHNERGHEDIFTNHTECSGPLSPAGPSKLSWSHAAEDWNVSFRTARVHVWTCIRCQSELRQEEGNIFRSQLLTKKCGSCPSFNPVVQGETRLETHCLALPCYKANSRGVPVTHTSRVRQNTSSCFPSRLRLGHVDKSLG